MSDAHTYPERDPDEGFLYVREWEDQRLLAEFEFLVDLFPVVASEIAFRADEPENRDGTGSITAKDVELYALADHVQGRLTSYKFRHRRAGGAEAD